MFPFSYPELLSGLSLVSSSLQAKQSIGGKESALKTKTYTALMLVDLL
jgi:hypothetical protein